MRPRLVSGFSIVAVACVAAAAAAFTDGAPASPTAPAAPASPATPAAVLPEGLGWEPVAGVEGLLAAWIVGSDTTSGPYLLRVRLADGARIPPHSHPDHRVTTVLSGTAYVGFGAKFDEKALVKIPAGAVYEVPAGVPHYAWAKAGDVEYQESGVGPTGTTVMKP